MIMRSIASFDHNAATAFATGSKIMAGKSIG
eukprot:CAMPEP_0185589996 /NCGR_PEP_ID=MMETSP0434-20130131/59070_1 /TAXON_ID=626734 ORGANISM="Favella taraikaensis, Strain Fe Narragansett Bay" /NCGR_SAMPLE_ID=MMETSP0434 /ASSEMBLY_ACC=CAM_ASM_000379 /LENGTH=30 /DNA_ID= /DNA_START= /DNA_END= /DNA_ORIENTATION=